MERKNKYEFEGEVCQNLNLQNLVQPHSCPQPLLLGASLHFSKCSCTDLLKFRFLAPIITGLSSQAPLINEPDSSLFKGNLHTGYIRGWTDPISAYLITAWCSQHSAPNRRGSCHSPPPPLPSSTHLNLAQVICAVKAIKQFLELKGRESSFSGCDQQNLKRIRFSLVHALPWPQFFLLLGWNAECRLKTVTGQGWTGNRGSRLGLWKLERKRTEQTEVWPSSQGWTKTAKKGSATLKQNRWRRACAERLWLSSSREYERIPRTATGLGITHQAVLTHSPNHFLSKPIPDYQFLKYWFSFWLFWDSSA